MQRAWTPPIRWVFVAATLLGLFSTLQAYRLTVLSAKDGMDIEVFHLLLLNLVYWYVPASFTSPIFRLGQRFRLDRERWLELGPYSGEERATMVSDLELHHMHVGMTRGEVEALIGPPDKLGGWEVDRYPRGSCAWYLESGPHMDDNWLVVVFDEADRLVRTDRYTD